MLFSLLCGICVWYMYILCALVCVRLKGKNVHLSIHREFPSAYGVVCSVEPL